MSEAVGLPHPKVEESELPRRIFYYEAAISCNACNNRSISSRVL
jgi:hypothetical protein